MNTAEISIHNKQMRATLNNWVNLTDSQWQQFALTFQVRTVNKFYCYDRSRNIPFVLDSIGIRC